MILLETGQLQVIAETDAVWEKLWALVGNPPVYPSKTITRYADEANFEFALGNFTMSVERGKWSMFVLEEGTVERIELVLQRLEQELANKPHTPPGKYLVVSLGDISPSEDIARIRSFLEMRLDWWGKDQPKPPTLWERLLS